MWPRSHPRSQQCASGLRLGPGLGLEATAICDDGSSAVHILVQPACLRDHLRVLNQAGGVLGGQMDKHMARWDGEVEDEVEDESVLRCKPTMGDCMQGL